MNQHNDKLKDPVKAYVKGIKGKKHGFKIASLHKPFRRGPRASTLTTIAR